RILAVLVEPKVVRLVAAETGELLADLEDSNSADLWYLRFSPDGAQLLALQWDQQVQVWDLRRIREELSKLGLDWDAPPFPPEPDKPRFKITKFTVVSEEHPEVPEKRGERDSPGAH